MDLGDDENESDVEDEHDEIPNQQPDDTSIYNTILDYGYNI